jgi:DNA-binding transcriptional regulator YdaS (Cro superfamily)
MKKKEHREFRAALAVELARASMSQRALAERIGANDTTFSGWITGAHKGPEDLVARIEKALKLDAGTLAPTEPKP